LVPIGRPAVSQHLKLLNDAGLITSVTVGRNSWHAIETEPLELIAEWAGRDRERRQDQSLNVARNDPVRY
jgi:DNA-binding transcriptional ArsR family regulator